MLSIQGALRSVPRPGGGRCVCRECLDYTSIVFFLQCQSWDCTLIISKMLLNSFRETEISHPVHCMSRNCPNWEKQWSPRNWNIGRNLTLGEGKGRAGMWVQPEKASSQNGSPYHADNLSDHLTGKTELS